MLEGRTAGEYMANHTSMIRREPIGVCAQVAPWNYPMMMAVWKLAPAIAAGNSSRAQAVRHDAGDHGAMAELMAEFLPPGVINVICGDRDTGRALVEHPIPQWSRSPGRCAPAWRSPARRPQTSSAATSSSAARRRWSCSTTPTSRPPPRPSRSPATSTPGRTARPRRRVLAAPEVYDDFVDALTEAADGRADRAGRGRRLVRPAQQRRTSSSG